MWNIEKAFYWPRLLFPVFVRRITFLLFEEVLLLSVILNQLFTFHKFSCFIRVVNWYLALADAAVRSQLTDKQCRVVVPSLFGTRDQFHGRQFFHRMRVGGWGMVSRWFKCINLSCSLFLRSGITSWRLGTSVLEHNQIIIIWTS